MAAEMIGIQPTFTHIGGSRAVAAASDYDAA
jgi:hypothetical protein